MPNFNPSITKRVRKRSLKVGTTEQIRWFVNFSDPETGERKLPSFPTRREAELFRSDLMSKVHTGTYVAAGKAPTMTEAVSHYLTNRAGEIKPSTLAGYRVVAKTITGPLLEGTTRERSDYSISGNLPRPGARLLKMLGQVSTADITTAMIRNWHREVVDQVGRYTANRALSMLKAVLSLCEEDFRIRAPAMPANLGRRRSRPRKDILTPAEVGQLIAAARRDDDHGVYYAFPFLVGTRISEQLGLLWEDVDFDRNIIRIRRIQERDGSITETTKTEAGTRDVDMGTTLREMLLSWRVRCPRLEGRLHRVFPGPGRLQPWPLMRIGGGGPLLYQKFPETLLGTRLQTAGPTLRDAPLRPALVYLNDAGSGRRSRLGSSPCRPRKPLCHAGALHPSSAGWGRSCRRSGTGFRGIRSGGASCLSLYS